MILSIHSTRLDLIPMTPAVLRALLAEDHDEAGRLLGVRWPVDCEIHRDVLELRLEQLDADPALQPWLLRAVVLREEGVAVGTIGFHAAPGHESLAELSPGGVEFGYGLTAAYRRRGLASEAIEAMMRSAREEHGVQRFVLSISPENGPSLGLAAKLGFRKIGWHMDEEDGPEDIFERQFGAAGARGTIRPAMASDAGAIAAVHVAAWQTAYRGLLPEALLAELNVEARAGFWQSLLGQPHQTLVAVLDGGVAGFCSVVPSRDADGDAAAVAEIAALYVAPENWRQGWGRALCEEAFRAAGQGGFSEMTLWVLAGNGPAVSFYEAQGFSRDAAVRTGIFSQGVTLPELRMRRRLQPG